MLFPFLFVLFQILCQLIMYSENISFEIDV
jgi:hypothetical protein